MVFRPPDKLPPPGLELASRIQKPGFTGRPFNSDGLRHSKPLTTSVSTLHGIYSSGKQNGEGVASNFTGAWAIVGEKASCKWRSVSRNHFLVSAVHVVRHSRLLRRRGLGMEGTLNDIRMYSKVILLPTQSPHVCCARRPPRFQLALTLRLTRLPQRVYQCQNTCSEIGHCLVF